jgi:periplasmic glucans biosynthesis protein
MDRVGIVDSSAKCRGNRRASSGIPSGRLDPATDSPDQISQWGTRLNRRHLLAGSLATSVAIGARGIQGAAAQAPTALPFDANVVRNLARQLAQQPFKKQDRTLPKELQNIDYDAYRALRFRPDRALWRGAELPFQVQLFHRGFIFLDRVDLFEVTGGRASPIQYSPALFDFGPLTPPPEGTDLGFAGFRLHAAMNRPNYYDEVGVFLGASYFRAVAKGQVYGLSARGLAIRTADPKGEEFPAFRSFWIERPQQKAASLVVHALLDS